jgi:hypothetical protein
MILVSAIAVLIQVQPAPQVNPDTLQAVRRSAQRAQVGYEGIARRLAPFTFGGERRSGCDEIVGRFCLQYTPRSGRRPLLEEAPRVAGARREVIEAFRRLVTLVPGDTAAAGTLVRYLIEDQRPGEAVAVARTFAWASADPVWSGFLLGLAHHAAGDDTAALAHFGSALDAIDSARRDEIESVAVLLERAERRFYERLDTGERLQYNELIWRLADPLFLTPANERFAEHLARHVWTRLLAMTPPVLDVLSWGRDLEELTLRYGLPVSRERIPTSGMEVRVLERYSPDQLSFVPAALRTRGLDLAPDPGDPWPLDVPAARDGYAPVGLSIKPLPHQLSSFPRGDSVHLLLSGVARLDSVGSQTGLLQTALVVLDVENYRPVRLLEAAGEWLPGDSVLLRFETTLPAADYVYSLEVLEPGSGWAARARYPVSLRGNSPGHLAVSDILVAHAFSDGPLPEDLSAPGIEPLADLVLQTGDTLGVFAELHGLAADRDGLTTYRVEWSLEPDRGGARLIRWFGRVLGLEGATATRVGWAGAATAGEVVSVPINLATDGAAEGGYTLRLIVEDLVTGSRTESLRRLRLADH